jgi:hypothetical protein
LQQPRIDTTEYHHQTVPSSKRGKHLRVPFPTFSTSGAMLAPIYIIHTPPTKPNYIPVDYGSEFDNNLFLFSKHGKSLHHVEHLPDAPSRSDIRLWDPAVDQDEFNKIISIPSTLLGSRFDG